jgi:hypothetical protein
MNLPFCHRQTHHTGQPPKMAEMLPYGSLSYQKSLYEKCDQTKMGAMSPLPIWMNGVAQRNGLILRGHPY